MNRVSRSLIVINPNASQSVTDGIESAINPLRGFGVVNINWIKVRMIFHSLSSTPI